MKTFKAAISLTLLIGLSGLGPTSGQEPVDLSADRNPQQSALDATINHFDVTEAIFRDGISELSLKKIDGLHLGFEEIIRDRIQDDPRALAPHFSLHLDGKSVRQIIGALCESDGRYTWSEDGSSINVFPRAAKDDPSYLLNLRIERIAINDIPDPDQGLTPLSKLFPNQQIGYIGSGLGDNSYLKPWTAVFDRLTVRQFINRMAEHMAPQTSWIWGGGKQERMFTFMKGGFETFRGPRAASN